MRRRDREITGFDEIVAIMEKCDVCRIALNDNGYPYILPLNFGMAVKNGVVELYFHGAMEGTKYDLIEKDNRAGFEMDCGHRLTAENADKSCTWTMKYASAVGRGQIEILDDDEKYDALCFLMKHYYQGEISFSEAVMAKTKVFKLVVEQMTGKIH